VAIVAAGDFEDTIKELDANVTRFEVDFDRVRRTRRTRHSFCQINLGGGGSPEAGSSEDGLRQ
jgi:hypothetical protein